MRVKAMWFLPLDTTFPISMVRRVSIIKRAESMTKLAKKGAYPIPLVHRFAADD